jgi:dTDP-4-dehydrorhamnose reductase
MYDYNGIHLSKMTTIILGGDGLLGKALSKHMCRKGVIATSRRATNDTRFFDIDTPISRLIDGTSCVNAIVLCIAESDVLRCEKDPSRSKEVNLDFVLRVAEQADNAKIPFVAFSSEYVFDGRSRDLYTEASKTCPKTQYGIQKQELERKIFLVNSKALVLRISKLASVTDNRSFLYRMREQMKNSKTYAAATDQRFTPISTIDACISIESLVKEGVIGLVNLCGSQTCSRYELAIMIRDKYKLHCNVRPCSIEELVLGYEVPPDLGMSCTKLTSLTKFVPQDLKGILGNEHC